MPRALVTDPMRNFKFLVQMSGPNILPNRGEISMGFMSVSGVSMVTDLIQYREGGYNTAYRKMPGQSDFSPLTLVHGIFHNRPEMWELAKKMFSVQMGNGELGMDTDFRFETTVKVLQHPVTRVPGGAIGNLLAPPAVWADTAKLGFKFYDCWVGTVQFNELDAMGSQPLISQMTLYHEGFDVIYGDAAAKI